MKMKTQDIKIYGLQQNLGRGKFIAVVGYIKGKHRPQINNLNLYLKELEKEGKTKHRAKRREEIIKVSVEVNKTENRKNSK